MHRFKFSRSGNVISDRKDACLDHGSELMYSTSTPFLDIKPVHPALTPFAVQRAKKKVVREAKGGCSAFERSPRDHQDRSTRKASWFDIGAATILDVADVLRTKQPITGQLLGALLNHQLGLGKD